MGGNHEVELKTFFNILFYIKERYSTAFAYNRFFHPKSPFLSAVIYDLNDCIVSQIGTIVKEYNGCCKESFTDADNYVINFPVGISMYHKALLLSATLSIDFLFYETKSNDN